MGKREIGQLQPFELVVIIIIADVASVPMENINIPLIQGIIPILGLLFGQLVFSYFNIKLPWFHKLFTGKSTMLIDKGKILASGTHKQLLETCPFYKEMYSLQKEVLEYDIH